MINYEKKYLKYKIKYLKYKNMLGSGKQNWGSIWEGLVESKQMRFFTSFKISNLSSKPFLPRPSHLKSGKKMPIYAGIILYHNNGDRTWRKPSHGTQIQGPYVLIQNTNDWAKEHFSEAGRGRVHDYLYDQATGTDMSEGSVCSAGFSIMYNTDSSNWEVKYSSIWLNKRFDKTACNNDGSQYLTTGESNLIETAIKLWIRKGIGAIGWIDISAFRYHNDEKNTKEFRSIVGRDLYYTEEWKKYFVRHSDSVREYEGQWYTKQNFIDHFGPDRGMREWEDAEL